MVWAERRLRRAVADGRGKCAGDSAPASAMAVPRIPTPRRPTRSVSVVALAPSRPSWAVRPSTSFGGAAHTPPKFVLPTEQPVPGFPRHIASMPFDMPLPAASPLPQQDALSVFRALQSRRTIAIWRWRSREFSGSSVEPAGRVLKEGSPVDVTRIVGPAERRVTKLGDARGGLFRNRRGGDETAGERRAAKPTFEAVLRRGRSEVSVEFLERAIPKVVVVRQEVGRDVLPAELEAKQ